MSWKLLAIPVALAIASPAMAQSQPMSAEQTQAREAIDQLIAEYTYDLDHGRTDLLADFFVEDGTFDFRDVNRFLEGREAIRSYYASRRTTHTTRHVTANHFVTFESPDRARIIRYISYFAGEGEPPLDNVVPNIAEYDEVVERQADGRWLFVSRIVVGVFGKPPKTTATN